MHEIHNYELWFKGEVVNQKIYEMASKNHFTAYRELLFQAMRHSVVGVFEIVQKNKNKLICKRKIILEKAIF